MATRGEVKQKIMQVTGLVGENPSNTDVQSWMEIQHEASNLLRLVNSMVRQARGRKPAAEQEGGMGEEFGDPVEEQTDTGWIMGQRIQQS